MDWHKLILFMHTAGQARQNSRKEKKEEIRATNIPTDQASVLQQWIGSKSLCSYPCSNGEKKKKSSHAYLHFFACTQLHVRRKIIERTRNICKKEMQEQKWAWCFGIVDRYAKMDWYKRRVATPSTATEFPAMTIQMKWEKKTNKKTKSNNTEWDFPIL